MTAVTLKDAWRQIYLKSHEILRDIQDLTDEDEIIKHCNSIKPLQNDFKKIINDLALSRQSSELTLEKIWNSLTFKNTEMENSFLQIQSTVLEKLTLLVDWNHKLNSNQLMIAFQIGYYLKYIQKNTNNSFNEIVDTLKLGRSTAYTRIKLFNNLGKYRTIYHSNMGVTFLTNHCTEIKNQIESLPDNEQTKWLFPSDYHDTWCFFDCIKRYLDCSEFPSLLNLLDIVDNNLETTVPIALIENSCVFLTGQLSNADAFTHMGNPQYLPGDKCIAVIIYNDGAGHCAYLYKLNGVWKTDDKPFYDKIKAGECKWVKFAQLKESLVQTYEKY